MWDGVFCFNQKGLRSMYVFFVFEIISCNFNLEILLDQIYFMGLLITYLEEFIYLGDYQLYSYMIFVIIRDVEILIYSVIFCFLMIIGSF